MRIFALAVATVLGMVPVAADGQILWDTPRLIGPESPRGVGFYWIRSSSLALETDAAMVTLPLPGMGGSLSLRGGVGVDSDDQLSGFAGIDVRAPLARHTPEQPLDLEWTAGIGAGGGTDDAQYIVVTLPMGISAGRSWTSGSIWLAPYVSLGVAFDLNVGDAAPDEDFRVTPAVDIGIDLALDPGRRFIIRAATSLGDRQALAVGLSVGGG